MRIRYSGRMLGSSCIVGLVLLLGTLAQAAPGDDVKPPTESKTVFEAQQVLDRIVALGEDDLQYFRTAVAEADKVEDFIIVLKYGSATARAAYMNRIPKPVAQRNEQRIKDLGDMPDSRIAAAAQSLEPLLAPGAFMLYRAQFLKQGGKYREAAEQYETAFKAGKGGRESYYDAACAWALAGDTNAAFKDLRRAVDAGWLDAKIFQEDEELASLRNDARWGKLIAGVQSKLDTLLNALPDTVLPLSVVKLPAPALDGSVSVEKALAQRRSIRQYAETPLTLQQVSQVLWAAYGITQPIPGFPQVRGGLRTAPSAGALYPLEIYLVAGNVTDLAPGVYRYDSEAHELQLIRRGDQRPELFDASLGQVWVKTAPASLVYSAVFERNTQKYGTRGRERYVCMDLGHTGENVYLQCTALGLGTVALGAFLDANVKLAIGMTKAEEPLYIMPLGKLKEKK